MVVGGGWFFFLFFFSGSLVSNPPPPPPPPPKKIIINSINSINQFNSIQAQLPLSPQFKIKKSQFFSASFKNPTQTGHSRGGKGHRPIVARACIRPSISQLAAQEIMILSPPLRAETDRSSLGLKKCRKRKGQAGRQAGRQAGDKGGGAIIIDSLNRFDSDVKMRSNKDG